VEVPLFPLNTVLFPGGPLPLRIFEPRYLDMISDCMKNDSPFGVLLIRDGGEVGPATTYDVGTLARVADWYQGSDGLLGITAVGEQRFRVISSCRQANGLNIGTIELLAEEEAMPIPDEYRFIPQILAGVLDDLGRLYESVDRHLDDAAWVSSRFIEVLPVDLEIKQHCLEEADAAARLKLVRELVNSARQ
jgi:Lon protease-like protein